MNDEQYEYVSKMLYYNITKYIFFNDESEKIKSLISEFEKAVKENSYETFVKKHLYVIYKIYFENNYLQKNLINKDSFWVSYNLISIIGNRYFETSYFSIHFNAISYLSEVFPKITTVTSIVYKHE